MPASEMPAGLRAHARYPEILFRAQAEIYRTYHMRDPRVFLQQGRPMGSRQLHRRAEAQPQPMTPTYVVASLPGQDQAGVPADAAVHAAQ